MNPIPENTAFYDLSDLSIVRVSGDDAQSFLQGQLSNDINYLSEESPHQLSAYCSPKGRILALFQILKLNEDYLLIAPQAVMDKVLPRLNMFVMRSAVEITPYEEMRLYGLYTAGADKQMLTALGENSLLLARLKNHHDRFLVLLDDQPAGALKTQNEWNGMDIQQNLPQIHIQSYEALIPQSVNLDIVGGVNFKKGCFPGQEIIARVKYRGKPKTRMMGVSLSAEIEVEVSAPIYIDERDRSAGEVVNIAHHAGATLLSISVPVTHILEGNIYLDDGKTVVLERIPSPYEITV